MENWGRKIAPRISEVTEFIRLPSWGSVVKMESRESIPRQKVWPSVEAGPHVMVIWRAAATSWRIFDGHISFCSIQIAMGGFYAPRYVETMVDSTVRAWHPRLFRP